MYKYSSDWLNGYNLNAEFPEFMVHPAYRKAHDIKIVSFNMGDISAEYALDAVGSRLVQALAGSDVRTNLVIVKGRDIYQALFRECPLPVFLTDSSAQSDSSEDMMRPP